MLLILILPVFFLKRLLLANKNLGVLRRDRTLAV